MTVAEDGTGVRRQRGARTRGRALAVQLVYSFEQNRYAEQPGCQLVPDDDLRNIDDDGRAFAFSLFELFRAQRPAIDAAIDQRLVNWTVGRLAVIDRAILRLGAVELLYCGDSTPAKVAINEYIELAKRYGTEANTARLVNGVLDRLAKDQRGSTAPPGAPVAEAP